MNVPFTTTTFRHVKAPEPHSVRDWTWGEFVDFIRANGHERVDDKNDAYLFGNYRLKEGTRSKNANVELVFGWALDLDKLSQTEIDAVLERLVDEGLAFVAYSTFQHTAEKPRLRVVGPLARPIPGAEWPAVWRAIVDTYSPGADEQCKDSRRLYWFPAARPGAPVELFSNDGKALEPPAVQAASKTVMPTDVGFDLDARDIIDAGLKLERCPSGSNPFEYGEHLCRTMPAAISGQGGSVALFRLARALVWGLEFPPEQAADLIGELYNPRCEPPWSEAEIEHKVTDAQQETGAPYPRGALAPPQPDNFDHLPLILQSGGRYWFRLPDSGDYTWRVKEQDAVRKARDLYGDAELASWNQSDNPRVGKPTIETRSRVVDRIVTAYHEPRTTFDLPTNTLTEGLRLDPTLSPKRSEAVEQWLAALAGDDLEALKMWIAGCRQALLTAPAPALGIVGPKEAGKSLIAAGLARLFGDPCPPVPASVLCAQFNGDLARCPIVLADEKLPDDLTGEAFRERVAARAHSIEPKGKERQALHGAVRFVVTANNPDRVLSLAGEKCDADIEAIAARWRLVEVTDVRGAACIDALESLKGADGSSVDLRTIAEHFLWLQATVEPHRGRFVGSPPDEKVAGLLRRAEAGRFVELFTLVDLYLADPGSWESRYVDGEAPLAKRGEPKPEAKVYWPLFKEDGRLFARYGVLGAILGETSQKVGAALRPFQRGERAKVRGILAYELDADRLGQVVR